MPQCMLGYHPREAHPPRETAAGADGTHTNGMHSCYDKILYFRLVDNIFHSFQETKINKWNSNTTT